MKQLSLHLRGDTFLKELEVFEILYGARCVEVPGESDNRMAVCIPPDRRFESCHLPQSAFND